MTKPALTRYLLIAFLLTKSVFIKSVDPFWGWGVGNVTPAAMVPFGTVKLSPTMHIGSEKNSGYYKNRPIIGFTHTQTSGTGGAPRYGNLLVMPVFTTNREITETAYIDEKASPGYYETKLVNQNEQIQVKLTASHWVGIHQYKWINADTTAKWLSVRLNVSYNHTRMKNGKPLTYVTGGEYILNNNTISGFVDSEGGWGGKCPYRLYFALTSDIDFEAFKNEGIKIDSQKKYSIPDNTNGKNFEQLVMNFPRAKAKNDVEIRLAISYLSESDAVNLLNANNAISFDSILAYTKAEWDNYLNTVNVEGGQEVDRQKFYSALRNTLIMPTDVTGHVSAFKKGEPQFWDYYATWDLYRSSMPLYTLLYPELQQKLIQSYLNIYKKYGWLPDAWIAGNYATIQGGSNADVVITDAIVKNLGGFDTKLALQAMRANAEQKSDNPKTKGRYIQSADNKGYQLPSTVTGSVSRAIEYAYNDYCISQSANVLGDKATARTYSKYANKIYDFFHPAYKMFWAKDSVGNWMPNFNPLSKSAHISNDPYFYEGGSVVYSAWLPQNMKRYINMCGGNAGYEERLDSIIQKGYFKLTNEPEFIIPYLYNYIGKHSKTVKTLYLCDEKFGLDKEGLPGQDDSGAMSAWFVFRGLGFYPVAGQNLYLLGVPLFDKICFKTQRGNIFTIKRTNVAAENKYVKQILLDGKPLRKTWLTHNEILNANVLTFEMTKNQE